MRGSALHARLALVPHERDHVFFDALLAGRKSRLAQLEPLNLGVGESLLVLKLCEVAGNTVYLCQFGLQRVADFVFETRAESFRGRIGRVCALCASSRGTSSATPFPTPSVPMPKKCSAFDGCWASRGRREATNRSRKSLNAQMERKPSTWDTSTATSHR